MEILNLEKSLDRIDQEIGQSIVVPRGIRYISDWDDYDKTYLFQFPHILDKKIPGCGYTEYCIRNNRNIILCSPRKILLQNKYDQHPDEVFLVINELDVSLNVDKDYNIIGTSRQLRSSSPTSDQQTNKEDVLIPPEENLEEKRVSQYRKLYFELLEYKARMNSQMKPLKILVTYDSYHIIKSILGNGANGLTGFGIFDQFYTIVDEFQSVFLDSIFKSTTEMKFIDDLQDVQNLCYVSATPMIGTYLRMIPEFKDLPYYFLDWEADQPERVSKPKLKVHTIQSLITTVRGIVNKYKLGKGETKVVGNSFVQSREAVIYVNSVNNICNIISKLDLEPEECNILCADTIENRARLKKRLGEGFLIGRVPLEGESRKMFTFCTRTVYLGADFYSDNAKTFILSDANIDCMAVDISLDLPQILGRQRLLSNPWKNEADFYYIPRAEDKSKTEEEFRRVIDGKLRDTRDGLENYESAPNKGKALKDIEHIIRTKNYKDDYITVKKVYNSETRCYEYVPTENQLVYISDLRAYDVQQKDYADRFSVFNALDLSLSTTMSPHVKDFFTVYDTLTNFTDKARFLCDSDSLFTPAELDEILHQVDPLLEDCYRHLGRDLIIGYGYNISNLRERLKREIVDVSRISELILDNFHVGDRLSKAFIKGKLRKIYESLGYGKTPKATDLRDWFSLRTNKFKNSQGKWESGFELLELKTE